MKKFVIGSIIVAAAVGLITYAAIGLGTAYLLHHLGTGNTLPIASSHTVKNITYCSPGGTPLKLDLYIPDEQGKTFPLVIYIHGGSWNSGSKDQQPTADYLPTLALTGYVVASVDYRLAPTYTFPAAVDDVKCAVRFLRANATQYQINPTKAGVIGESAGGYLAAFMGVTGDNPTFKVGQYLHESDTVQAVIDISGPTDFTAPDTAASLSSIAVARAFLGAASPSAASPVTYASTQSAPFYIIHGENDTTVPPSQSEELKNKLTAAGVQAQLVLVPNAGHSIDATSAKTAYAQLVVNMLSFLNQHLRS